MFEEGRVPKATYLRKKQQGKFPIKPQEVPNGDKEAYRRKMRRQRQIYQMLRNRHGR